MQRRDFSRAVEITSPCNENWNEMPGTDLVRYCGECQRSVHNVDRISKKQLRHLMAKSGSRLCIRYTDIAEPRSSFRTLYKLTRKTSRLAAGMFSATLGLTSVVVANTTSPRPAASFAQVYPTDDVTNNGNGTFEGVIYAPDGSVIRFATIYITHMATKDVKSATTDWNGFYKLSTLPAGTYTLRVEAENYAAAYVPNLVLRPGDVVRMDQTLSITSVKQPEETGEVVELRVGGGRLIAPKSPLVKAALEDDLEQVKELLRTSDSNRRDSLTNLSALECAVRNANREMIQTLLWSKANINAKDKNGQTVLMMIGPEATSDLVWDLINAGAKVNDTDNDGDTALMESARMNNTEVMKALLDAGAKVNVANRDGQSALIVAASEGFVNGVHLLIQAGAEINQRDKAGRSALSYARANESRAVIRLLVSCNAVDFEEAKQPDDK